MKDSKKRGAEKNVKPVFTRKKDVNVFATDSGITVVAHMKDRVHEMEVEVDVRFPTMTITDVRATMISVPYEECQKALAALSGAVGLEIKKGLTQRMEEAIGGCFGCSHLTNLVMEACYNALPGQYAKFMEHFSDLINDMDDMERTKAFITLSPAMLNACVAYCEDSNRIVEAKKLPETKRISELKERLLSIIGDHAKKNT
jgi:hypothetical protein